MYDIGKSGIFDWNNVSDEDIITVFAGLGWGDEAYKVIAYKTIQKQVLVPRVALKKECERTKGNISAAKRESLIYNARLQEFRDTNTLCNIKLQNMTREQVVSYLARRGIKAKFTEAKLARICKRLDDEIKRMNDYLQMN